MANTPNYGLLKPDRTDNINDVDTSLANNFTTIDLEIKNRKDEIDGHIAGTNGQHTSEVITHADGNVKTTLENHETRLGNAETELTDHEGRLTDIETLGLDLLGPDVENRIATLESDVEGFLAPATFDAMNQQSYTFDEYRIGYVQNALAPINEQLAESTQQLDDIATTTVYKNKLTYKGAAVTTYLSYDLAKYNDIFSKLKTDNCDAEVVQLVGVASGTDSTFQPLMSDSIINNAIQAATTNNVKIQMIKLHVNIGFDDSTDKSIINPTDIPTWFTNYEVVVKHYAQIAVNNNIPILTIGNELKSLSVSSNAGYWQTLIQNVKAVYPTLKISYASKYSETTRALDEKKKGQSNLFDYLDILCFNLYPNLSNKVYDGTNISKSELKEAMYSSIEGYNFIGVVADAYNTYKKDVIIAETGIMPKNSGKFIMPSDETGTINETVQSLYYETMFETFGKMHQVVGMFIWHTGSPFDFFGRSGEQTIKDYFGGVL